MIDTSVKLPQPPHAYGATYGRLHRGHIIRSIIGGFIILVWAAVAVTAASLKDDLPTLIGEGDVPTHFLIFFAWAIPLVMVGGLGDVLFRYDQGVFADDVYRKRREWGETVFRDWLEQRFTLACSPSDALSLLNGNYAYVTDLHEAPLLRTKKRVFLQLPSDLSPLSWLGATNADRLGKNDADLPPLREQGMHLMIVPDPRPRPAAKQWV